LQKVAKLVNILTHANQMPEVDIVSMGKIIYTTIQNPSL